VLFTGPAILVRKKNKNSEIREIRAKKNDNKQSLTPTQEAIK